MKMALFEGRFKQLTKKLRNYRKIEVPRGYFPVDVIGDAEAKRIRYVISVEFLNNGWRFARLLDEYEDGIRMYAGGPITLPCSVRRFEEALYQDRLSSRLSIKN